MGSNGKKISTLLILILTLICIIPFFSDVSADSETSWIDQINHPSIQFSIDNGSVVYNLGNFSVGLNVQGCNSYDLTIVPALYSVSYKTSWGNTDVQIYDWAQGSPNSQNSFFYSIDVSDAPQGPQQIEVTAVGGGKSFGIGAYMGDFSITSTSVINFNVSSPPKTPSSPAQTVDTSGTPGDCPLVLDSSGNPHIAYTAVAVGNPNAFDWYQYDLVKYASWTGYNWSIQTVALGRVYSLALDAKGNPHILYGNYGDPLMYASQTGLNWTSQIVDTKRVNGASFGAIAFNSHGIPNIAYTNGTTIKYATWTGSNWNIQIIANYSEISFHSLVIDKNDTPHIMLGYIVNVKDNGADSFHSFEAPKIAVYRNSSWILQNVTSSLSSPIRSVGNMVLDSRGYPNLVYGVADFGSANGSLAYASWDGSTWKTQIVVSMAQYEINGFLTLDSDDNPNIIYDSNSTLNYASSTGTNWNTQTIDTGTTVKGQKFLVLDSKDNLHISCLGHFNTPNGYIQYANIMYIATTKPLQPSTGFKIPWLIAAFAVLIIAIGVVIVMTIYKRRHKGTVKP